MSEDAHHIYSLDIVLRFAELYANVTPWPNVSAWVSEEIPGFGAVLQVQRSPFFAPHWTRSVYTERPRTGTCWNPTGNVFRSEGVTESRT